MKLLTTLFIALTFLLCAPFFSNATALAMSYDNVAAPQTADEALDEASQYSRGYGVERDMARAFGIYLELLLGAELNLAQRQQIVEILKKDFAQNCDTGGNCTTIVRRFDAATTRINTTNSFVDLGRWGLTENEFLNLSIHEMVLKTQIEYYYDDAISSARNGDIVAILLLADSFATSGKVEGGEALSLEYYRIAADLGNPRAMAEYAHLVHQGKYANMQPTAATAIFERAIALGDPIAMRRLANIHGVENRRQQELALLERAAALGYVQAMSDLSAYYAYCESSNCDFQKGVDWAKRAFDSQIGAIHPDLELMFSSLFSDHDESQLAKWIREKARSDNSISRFKTVWGGVINGMTNAQMERARPQLLALTHSPGIGALLAANTLQQWYDYRCRPDGVQTYQCVDKE
jgi:TPR repeat protein